MKTRVELQAKLEEILGSRNVYYQPPPSVKMDYPAIRYSKNDIEGRYANDKIYSKLTRYEIIVIDKRPDNSVIDKLLELRYCSYDRHYVADNLNHDVFAIYL